MSDKVNPTDHNAYRLEFSEFDLASSLIQGLNAIGFPIPLDVQCTSDWEHNFSEFFVKHLEGFTLVETKK